MRPSTTIPWPGRNLILPLLFALVACAPAAAQWSQTNGPLGGIVLTLAVDGSHVLAGTQDGGAFLSSDHGRNWTRTSQGLSMGWVKRAKALAGTFFVQTLDDRVFRMPQVGGAWAEIDTSGNSLDLSTAYAQDDLCLAGNRDGRLFRSIDNGVHWVPLKTKPTHRAIAAIGTYGRYLLASNDSTEVFRSADTGSTWEKLPFGIHNSNVIGFSGFGPYLYLAGSGSGLSRSPDSGKTWEYGIELGFYGGVSFLANEGGSAYVGRMGQDGFARSTDGGAHWTSIGASIQGAYVLGFAAQNDTLFLGTQNMGVLRSVDSGNTWGSSNDGLIASKVPYLDSHGSVLFAGAEASGLFRSDDAGSTWPWVAMVDYEGSFSIEECGVYLCAAGAHTFIRSEDGGVHWADQSSPTLLERTFLSMARVGQSTYLGSKGGFIHRTQDGKDWEWVLETVVDEHANAMVNVDGILLVGSGGDGVMRSGDGIRWTLANAGLGNDTILAMAVAGSTVLAKTASGLFRTQDRGDHWTSANRGLGDLTALSMVGAGNEFYVGCAGGFLFVSRDSGGSWQEVEVPLENLSILSLAADSAYLYAGTEGRGIWKRRLDRMNVSSLPSTRNGRKAFSLRPAPDGKGLDLLIEKGSDVGLDIMDLQGGLVARFPARRYSAGLHRFRVNGAMARNGIYFGRLTVDGEKATVRVPIHGN